MKSLFGALLCFVLAQTQAWAISGGPVYTNSSLVGTYAGVLRPLFDPTNPLSSNSVGVFSMGVPQTGTGTGTFVMFSQGRVFSGTVRGVADPKTSAVRAVLAATFTYNLTTITIDNTGTPQSVTTSVTANANGSMDAKAFTLGSGSVLGTAATRIKGTAVLNIDQGQVAANGQPVITAVLQMTVIGFRQSTSAPSSTG